MMEIRLKSTRLEPLFLCLCLLTGKILGQIKGETVVTVREGSEAVLPCFIRPERDIRQDVFNWKKDGQNVFFYDKGQHYNNGLAGQDKQFKGRVSHLPDQLQFSNASIRIRDTKVSDSGTYSCDFSPDEPNRQTSYIKLDVVVPVVKVTEGGEIVLPCFTRPERDITQDVFDWKKDGQMEVFFYKKGLHYNNGLTGQDEQFKGRVSHLPDILEFGAAYIRINNTKLSDSGIYSCEFSPDEPNRQRFNIRLAIIAVVKVREGSEAVLPCFIRPERDIRQDVFDWKKDGQNVFFYKKGQHYNHGHDGQDEQFKGRVSHFPDQLQFSNASIVIRDTTESDSGTYTCDVSPDQPIRQTFDINLVVDCALTDRSEENIPDASLKPSVTILDHTRDEAQLQCEVLGVSPEPEVEWKDSSGNILPAEEPQVTDRGYSYDVILKTTVKKTDNYHCVVTQERICHKVSAVVFVFFHGAVTKQCVTILHQTKDWSLLKCEVLGASPKPKVEWQDSSGNILPAKEPQVTERGGSYDIILKTTVTKTDNFYCVVTQEEINHQTKAEIYVHIGGSPTGHVVTAVVAVLISLVVVGVPLFLLYKKYKKIRNWMKASEMDRERNGQNHLLN